MGDIQTVHELMMMSPVHRKWSADEFIRFVCTPLILRQYHFTKDRKAWASWAFFSEEVAHAFMNRTRKLTPEDWQSGNVLWFIDLLAPHGNVRELVTDIRDKVLVDHDYGMWARTFGTGKVQKIGFFERKK